MVTVITILANLLAKTLNSIFKLSIKIYPNINKFYFLVRKYKAMIHAHTWVKLKL